MHIDIQTDSCLKRQRFIMTDIYSGVQRGPQMNSFHFLFFTFQFFSIPLCVDFVNVSQARQNTDNKLNS